MPRPKLENPKKLVAGRVDADVKRKLRRILRKLKCKESQYVRDAVTAAVERDSQGAGA